MSQPKVVKGGAFRQRNDGEFLTVERVLTQILAEVGAHLKKEGPGRSLLEDVLHPLH